MSEKKTPPKERAKAKRYWKNPTFFAKFGTVTGLVTRTQAEEFNRVTPKESKLENWTLNYDPVAKRREEAKKKSRARAGLPEEN